MTTASTTPPANSSARGTVRPVPVVDSDTPPPAPSGSGSADTTPDQGQEGELPEWARKRLTKANAEAANYRTRLREAEARRSAAQTPTDVEAALAQLREKNAELERSIARGEAARKVGLPDELAQRLRGDTTEELEADARSLLRFTSGSPSVASLRGGLDPCDDQEPFDPVREARRARAARH